MWRNWGGNQHCAPVAFEQPGSVADVAAAVRRAGAAGRSVRVAGAGHSFSDLVPTNGHLLSLARMDRVLRADRDSGLVTVEAGITLNALSARLAELGLALENLGDISVQSVAGAISTGTHGTGAKLRNISAQVAALDLVTADGEVFSCSADEAPDVFRAARVSLGALGVIVAVTLRCVPAFTLRGVDVPAPLEPTLEAVQRLADEHEHFEFFTFPHSDLALTRTNTRVDAPPAPPSAIRAFADDVLLGNVAFGACCTAGRLVPAAIPAINRNVAKWWGSHERVDRSDRIFASPRMVRFVEMEYALPRERAADAIRAVRTLIDQRGFHVPFPLELRFVAPDDAFLSPASGRATAYVAVHQLRGMAHEPYFRAVEAIMDRWGGRPHWGKLHFQTAATLAPRYPEWDRFQAVRARLDPEGRFANVGLRRVLGAP